MTEQERIIIINAIKNILNMKIIDDKEFTLLNEYYIKDDRPFALVKDEIIELSNDKNYRDKIINNLKINLNKKIIISVIDFKDNNKDYFQIKYSDGTTKIEQNFFGKSGAEVFEIVKQKFQNKPTEIFEKLMTDIINKNSIDNTSNAQTKNKQKTLTNPSTHLKWYDEENGFMNMLFYIFITGISAGIIIMLILNIFIK